MAEKKQAQQAKVESTFKPTPEHPVDYKAVQENVAAQFPMVQIIDKDGKVVNKDIMPDLSDEQLVDLMERMVFSRTLHEETTKFSKQGRLGFYGPTLGQEASQMASAAVIEKDDWLYGAYRDIPVLISHGGTIAQGFLWSKGHVDGGTYGEDGNVKAMVPQIIIGAQYVQATGNALGEKLKGTNNVTFTYTGDGGTSQGDFYEGINYAGRYQVPAVYIVQNNGYAISTPREKASHAPTLAQKSAAAGIPGVQVDGMDALAVYVVTKQAREWAAAGNGPVLIETITSRMAPHSTAGDDPSRYRDQASYDYWEERDPLKRYRIFLEGKDLWTDEHEEEIKEKFVEEIGEAMKDAESRPEMKISESLKWMYANPTSNVKEQIEYYESKGE